MYSINYHEEVEKDFKELGHATTLLVLKKIKKLAKNPIIGDDLGNKANMNLSGYKKAYVDNKRVRIIYKIIDDKIEIFVLAVGKRDEMEVYQKAFGRIQS
ncbi:MAG: type II toxin-antitoxin system RelE/ParE family toxin [Campylobacterota bacterium]|nr:type II toxin-antitoxin system RelE/ParE family toxin [Campylobacterota bacterium]